MEPVLIPLLKGERARWPAGSEEDDRALLAALVRHGIHALASHRMRQGLLADLPVKAAHTLARVAVQRAAVEEVFAAELRRILSALAEASVPAVLMKGSALAYTHYPDPALRPRIDTDLMIPRSHRDVARRVFEQRDYTPFNGISGDLVAHQCTYSRIDPLGLRHAYDLHWKIVNPPIAADVLPWDAVYERAVAVPSLSPVAHRFCDAHALLLSCVHRLAHHFDDARLLWIYDIHLLATGMEAKDWEEFRRVVRDPAAAALCRRSLATATSLLGTIVPADAAGDLESRADETAVAAFARRPSRVDLLRSDLAALPGWRRKAQLVREHVLPPPAFMKNQYGVSNPLLLAACYVHRWVRGARHWFRPIVQ